MNISRKQIILLILAIFILAISISILTYINSQQIITVTYKNTSKVTIQKIGDGARSLEKETIIKKSGGKLKVIKGKYLLKYTGNSGYRSDYENISVENKPVDIYLDPGYSSEKLDTLLNNEFEDIALALNTKYENMGDYNIQKGKLYNKGEWYGTTLQYKGNDVFNYDTLRVVMKKENGKWSVVTKPNIVLSAKDYPNIPKGILRDVNNVQNAPFVEKYTDPNGKVYFP